MPKAARSLLSLLTGFGLAAAAVAEPPADCGRFTVEMPMKHEVATASVLANTLGRRNSVRAESQRLLREARAQAVTTEPPRDFCPAACELASLPEVIFRSAPRKVLARYDDREHCAGLLETTGQEPLAFDHREFPSLEGFEAWISDFTRGEGSDGKDLYGRCDASCSPRYTYVIADGPAGIAVDTSVVCGHARDRDDNRYELSYALRWTCRDRSSAARRQAAP